MELLTIGQAAKFLKVSVNTLRNMIRRHELPYLRIRRQIRFVKEDLENWVRDQVQAPCGAVDRSSAFRPFRKVGAL